MIPLDRVDVLEAALTILDDFGRSTEVRGRFVALYLGLRRMGSDLPALGNAAVIPAGDIERFLDNMFTKTHRPEPFVVLTAPFGQSTSPTAPYSARTGETAPGRRYPTNTWRNNFGIQKGVGCPAAADVVKRLLDEPTVRLACPHMAEDPEGRHVCSLADTTYRGEEHSIWLRVTGDGYQVTDLDTPAVYEPYLSPREAQVPVFPLIAALYCMSPTGVYPTRDRVGIPEFAQDFAFDLSFIEDYFDCDPDSPRNADLLAYVQGFVLAPAVEEEAEEALEPPTELPELSPAGQINTGIGAELAVAQDLQHHGWHVSYRGNQRGVGYDLEATRNGSTLRVEAKSSVGFTNPELTQTEWDAAQRHGEEFVLAVVDFFGSDEQHIWYVRNPAVTAVPVERPTTAYRFIRADISPLAAEAEFL